MSRLVTQPGTSSSKRSGTKHDPLKFPSCTPSGTNPYQANKLVFFFFFGQFFHIWNSRDLTRHFFCGWSIFGVQMEDPSSYHPKQWRHPSKRAQGQRYLNFLIHSWSYHYFVTDLSELLQALLDLNCCLFYIVIYSIQYWTLWRY